MAVTVEMKEDDKMKKKRKKERKKEQMSEQKKYSVTAASLPIEITILLFGFQNLEWYTLGVKWSLASPKLVPFGAVIPIFRWAHQVDPLAITIPPPPPPPPRHQSKIPLPEQR